MSYDGEGNVFVRLEDIIDIFEEPMLSCRDLPTAMVKALTAFLSSRTTTISNQNILVWTDHQPTAFQGCRLKGS